MAFHSILVLKLLVLLAVANTAPLIAKKMFRSHMAWPIDGGARFFDHRPVFGPSKTIRGIGLALLFTVITATIIDFTPRIGVMAAAAAMAGDLLASFIKRRVGLPASSRATGLDQIPESLLPLLACRGTLGLSFLDIGVGVIAFFVGEIILARLVYRLGLRDQPY